MVHLDSYINALKITWIRRLISTNSKYKTLFETMHTNINDLSLFDRVGFTNLHKVRALD